MKNWQIKTLGEVCEIKSGKNQKNVINPNGKYPIYGSSGIFGYADEYICDENTTIIGRKGTINSPIYVTTKFWNVDTAFGLCAKEDLNPKFLYYFCLGFNFKKLDKSTTIPSLSKSDLLSIQLNIPSLQTQQAIVSKIEELFSELDKGIEDLKTAQQQLKTYRQSVLKWAFEGKLTNDNVKDGELPKGWEKLKIKDVCEIKGGKNQSKVINPNGKYPIYGSSGIFGYADEYICDENTTIVGRKGNINSPLFVTTKFWNVDTAFGLCVNNKYDSKLLYYFCLGFNFKKLDKSTTIPSLAKSDILSIDIQVPLIEEQQQLVQEIESRLSVADKMEESIAQSLLQAEALRQSILKKAFSGEMV
jgi:type I restriction enzyme, S subunit